MSQISFQATPNPNSLKFTHATASFIPSGMESFTSPAECADHPLGAALFAIEGVRNVFLLPQFATITKAPEADWDAVLPHVQAVFESHIG